MEIQPIKKQSVTDQAFDQILRFIVNRQWLPGEKIPSENELAASFTVSRVSIRAALQKLIALGLLDARVGEGTFVLKTSPAHYFRSLIPTMLLTYRDDRDVSELRRGIEIECAMLAAERATMNEIEQIEAAYSRMNVLIHCDDLAEYIAADFTFHLSIAKASHNQMLVDVMTILKDILYMHYTDMIKAMGPEIGFDYHGQILEAIKARSPEQAAENVRKMMNCFIGQLDAYQSVKDNKDG
ncbi:hypothetical protein AXX12_05875 [Anaerosporomusa subterranea]|uniref:HTH gntR-type domain-containing protein n=1 Tax=Anaerosporomusa subterranea TaxID=1794912 RepID=A0A154BPU8_ANASB|nr:FadR/GntR family transcriptional regulator [Anaerosporomusa subterranea]KYZ75966.1 hypothetical protein AXX12_05875 [Anaerosporomusa subterranea]